MRKKKHIKNILLLINEVRHLVGHLYYLYLKIQSLLPHPKKKNLSLN